MKLATKNILRIERIKRGYTQEDVAQYLNMGRASYAQYETGKNTPTTENIIKLAYLYNVTTDYLLGVNLKDALKVGAKQGFEMGDEMSDEIIEKMERKRVRKKKSTQE